MKTLANINQLDLVIINDFLQTVITGAYTKALETTASKYNPIAVQFSYDANGTRIVGGYAKFNGFVCINQAKINPDTGKYTGIWDLIFITYEAIIEAYKRLDTYGEIMSIPFAKITNTDGISYLRNPMVAAASDPADTSLRYIADVVNYKRTVPAGATAVTHTVSVAKYDIKVTEEGVYINGPYAASPSIQNAGITLFTTAQIDPPNAGDAGYVAP